MKLTKTTFLIIILTFNGLFINSSKASVFTAEWLKEGLSILILFDSQREKEDKMPFSPEQWKLFDQTVCWLNGFIVGANALAAADNKSDLAMPPKEWLDPIKIAPLLLEHMNKNSGIIKPLTPARLIMMSWYFNNHPKSSEREKAFSLHLLSNQ